MRSCAGVGAAGSRARHTHVRILWHSGIVAGRFSGAEQIIPHLTEAFAERGRCRRYLSPLLAKGYGNDQ
jgi:hypothetical protein